MNRLDRDLFIGELKTWLGTPFGIGSPQKGIATDCLNYILKSASDLFPEFKSIFGDMSTVGIRSVYRIQDIPEFISAFDTHSEVIYEISSKSYQEGDIVVFKNGKYLSHCAVSLENGYFIETMKGSSVGVKFLCPQVLTKIAKVYRIRRFD